MSDLAHLLLIGALGALTYAGCWGIEWACRVGRREVDGDGGTDGDDG